MINFRYILNILGKLLLVESAAFLLCMGVAMIYGENDANAFLISAGITLVAACILIFSVKVKDRVLAKRDGYFIVSCIWILFTVFGSLPFMISGYIPSFPDAFFEVMSGFTTTGSSILNEVEALPHASLFWRSLTQWMGGLGIVVILLAILPSLGIEGRDLYVAEVPGPMHDKFSYTFNSTAIRMYILYVGLTAAETVMLMFGGMSFFDAICHSFACMATGGYSTKTESLAYWDSPYIQYVITVFMFIGGTNYALLYSLFKGKAMQLFKDEEFRLYTGITVTVSLVIAGVLYFGGYSGLEKSIRDAFFQVVTILTTTGFASADYLYWPFVAQMLLFVLLFIGGSAGSTAGGIKCVRILLLFKNAFNELKRIIHPNGVINVKYNGKSVRPELLSSIMSFFCMYMFTFVIGSIVMSCFTDIVTATSAVITCLSNVGPGFGDVGPMSNFSSLNGFCKIFLSFIMLVGRLELFTFFVIFTSTFWKR